MFASHSWPRWGNDRIQEVLRTQRDAYANLNNQTLHYVNQGVTINEIHNVYEVPQSLQQSWAARSYHGDVQNNVRGVVNRFIGHFDGNPANLIPLSPVGLGAALRRDDGRLGQDHRQGQGARWRRASTCTPPRSSTGWCSPSRRTMPARRLLADAYEQLGYQAESTSVRNTFLQGAFELRNGHAGRRAAALDRSRRRAGDDDRAVARLPRHQHGPEEGRGPAATRSTSSRPTTARSTRSSSSNATLTNIKGFQAPKPDLTVTVNRADLNRVMMGVATFDQLADEGKARFEGDRTVIAQAARPDGHVHAGLRDPAGHRADRAPGAARAVVRAAGHRPDSD